MAARAERLATAAEVAPRAAADIRRVVADTSVEAAIPPVVAEDTAEAAGTAAEDTDRRMANEL